MLGGCGRAEASASVASELGESCDGQSHGIEPDVAIQPNKNLEFGGDSHNQLGRTGPKPVLPMELESIVGPKVSC